MNSAAQVSTPNVFILDTSFLIKYANRYYWTIEPYTALTSLGSVIVIPEGVKEEYFPHGRTKELFEDGGFGKIAQLLGVSDVTDYRKSLQEVFAEKLEEKVEQNNRRYSPLSVTDKTVVQATFDYATEGLEVGVATADRGIVEEVDKMRDALNLNINIYSPWRTPVKHDSIDFLITNHVLEELKRAVSIKNAIRAFLIVARDINIGGGVKFNIAYDAYFQRESDSTYPNPNNSYLMRYLPFSDSSEYDYRTWVEMAGQKECILFFEKPSPIIIPVRQESVPINAFQKKNLLVGSKDKRAHERNQMLLLNRKYRVMDWAIIHEHDIEKFERSTVGIFYQLRRQV